MIVVWEGDVSVPETLKFDRHTVLWIKPGTVVRMGAKASLVCHGWLEAKDVAFVPLTHLGTWDAVAMATGNLMYCTFKGGRYVGPVEGMPPAWKLRRRKEFVWGGEVLTVDVTPEKKMRKRERA